VFLLFALKVNFRLKLRVIKYGKSMTKSHLTHKISFEF